jgi:2-polyprenyl-3-methyl-5-hydroxy-6-metoxy-1,4-benzoquinol methylase
LARIPPSLAADFDVEALVIDDSSTDATFGRGDAVRRAQAVPFALTVLFNPVNLGYGGNQKVGFHYAITHDFDFVALVHGDGQYAPESLPDLLGPLTSGDADVVLGSRMLVPGAARRGGMPFYKFAGNRVLTWVENRLLGTRLSEFHSGYRIYSTEALRRIPFHLNSDVFDFDTQIIIQLVLAGLRIRELAIPTYYGNEICRVNGLKYAKDVVVACLKVRAQQLSLFYDRKYDCAPPDRSPSRLDFPSTHTLAFERIPPGSRVLDIGCGGGHLTHALRGRGCRTAGIDQRPPARGSDLDDFRIGDLNQSPLPFDLAEVDCAVMLDVVEHLASPERFVDDFLRAASRNPGVRLLASTGNVAFGVMRLMLLLGQFNYGKRGILDLTHTRLFTFRTFRRLFEQSGFRVLEICGVPAPFPLALGNGRLARLLLTVNRALIRVSRTLFSYQIFVVVQPRPSLESLLARAQHEAGCRTASAEH